MVRTPYPELGCAVILLNICVQRVGGVPNLLMSLVISICFSEDMYLNDMYTKFDFVALFHLPF